MSEFRPVETKADLDTLDDAEIVAGYFAGRGGDSEPGSDKSQRVLARLAQRSRRQQARLD